MSKTSKIAVQQETDYRSRLYSIMCYDDEDSNLNIKKVTDLINEDTSVEHWLYQKHDNDFWTAEDEKANPNHKAGEKKKTHYHFLLRFKQGHTKSAFCKHFPELGLKLHNEGSLWVAWGQEKDACQYICTHQTAKEKTPYDWRTCITSSQGTDNDDVKTLIRKYCEEQGKRQVFNETAAKLISLRFDEHYSSRQMADYAAQNELMAEYIRIQPIIRDIETHEAQTQDKALQITCRMMHDFYCNVYEHFSEQRNASIIESPEEIAEYLSQLAIQQVKQMAETTKSKSKFLTAELQALKDEISRLRKIDPLTGEYKE